MIEKNLNEIILKTPFFLFFFLSILMKNITFTINYFSLNI